MHECDGGADTKHNGYSRQDRGHVHGPGHIPNVSCRNRGAGARTNVLRHHEAGESSTAGSAWDRNSLKIREGKKPVQGSVPFLKRVFQTTRFASQELETSWPCLPLNIAEIGSGGGDVPAANLGFG